MLDFFHFVLLLIFQYTKLVRGHIKLFKTLDEHTQFTDTLHLNFSRADAIAAVISIILLVTQYDQFLTF